MKRDIPSAEVESKRYVVGFGIGPGGRREEEEDRGSLEHQLGVEVSLVHCNGYQVW